MVRTAIGMVQLKTAPMVPTVLAHVSERKNDSFFRPDEPDEPEDDESEEEPEDELESDIYHMKHHEPNIT